jgi:tetratricopeptide (TPR) repeat protein
MAATISLCMLCRDEEHCIAQAIASVASIITQVIVVDTGSKDATISIARQLGAQVIERPWDDDFSAPRNLGIAAATGDWILVLDADEAIAARDLPELLALTQAPTTCYLFNQRHYSADIRLSAFVPCRGEYPEWERQYPGYFESALCRLFPRNPAIEYRGRVHELVEHSIQANPHFSLKLSRIPIHHYGHTEETRRRKNKASLYTPLGEQKLTDNPRDWKGYYELGVEHNVNGNLEGSINAFKKSVELNPQYVPTWVNFGYVLCERGLYQDAEKALFNALRLDPKAHEAYCNLGVVYLRNKALPKAEQAFRQAIRLQPLYANAYVNLGKALCFQGRIAEAVNIYQRVLDLLPQCSAAKVDLGSIYSMSKNYPLAVRYLTEAVAEAPQMPLAHFQLGQLQIALQENAQALLSLKRFAELESKCHGSVPQDVLRQIADLEKQTHA